MSYSNFSKIAVSPCRTCVRAFLGYICTRESWTHNITIHPIIREEEVPFELELIGKGHNSNSKQSTDTKSIICTHNQRKLLNHKPFNAKVQKNSIYIYIRDYTRTQHRSKQGFVKILRDFVVSIDFLFTNVWWKLWTNRIPPLQSKTLKLQK